MNGSQASTNAPSLNASAMICYRETARLNPFRILRQLVSDYPRELRYTNALGLRAGYVLVKGVL